MPLIFKTELQLAQWQHRNPNKVRLISDEEMSRILSDEPDGKTIVAKTSRRSSLTDVVQNQQGDEPVDFNALIERVLAEEYGPSRNGGASAPRLADEELSALVDRFVIEEFERRGYPQNVTPAQPVVDRVTKKQAAMEKAEMVEAGTSVLLGSMLWVLLLIGIPLVGLVVLFGLRDAPFATITALIIAFLFRGGKK